MAGFKGLGERRYDDALEVEIRGWMAELGVDVEGADLMAALKSGVSLCELANALQPGVITAKVSAAAMPFKQMENIGYFLAAAEALGVQASDRFQTVDLYEAKQPAQVLLCLQVLRRLTTPAAPAPAPAGTGKKGPPSVKASKGTGPPKSSARGTAAKPVIPRGKGKPGGPNASKKPTGKRTGPPPLAGKAAAAALQQEIISNGTGNIKKIESLRRASLLPDGDMAAAAAAAAAEMEELEEGEFEEDDEDV